MKNINKKPLHFIILGGGTAGWMAANLLVQKWSSDQVKVTLIESPEIGIVGVGEGSTPTLKRFFQLIDVTEKQWMPHCNATYKVNIRFDEWSPASGINSYGHPFTTQVDTFTAPSFITNSMNRRMGMNVYTKPEKFLLNGWLAQGGKGPIASENFPFIMEYGYHFDANLLGQFLAGLAESRGVIHRREYIDNCERDSTGNIKSLVTKSSEKISDDFFIDCSGFSSLLMQKALKIPFQSFKKNLFNDAAVVMKTEIDKNIPVETVSTALSAGWCWKIPLANRFGNGYVYSSDFLSPEKAEQEFRKHIDCINGDQECRHLTMKVGQLTEHWAHNCIALGLSQGFIEPLEATALHLVQVSIELFMELFEKGGFSHLNREIYNQKIRHRFEKVRDYIVAHYKLNTRTDSDYWIENRDNMNLSDSLVNILDVWFQRGDLGAEIERQQLNSHFDVVSWNCLLSGYGAFPKLKKLHREKQQAVDLYLTCGIEKFMMGCALNFNSHEVNLAALSP